MEIDAKPLPTQSHSPRRGVTGFTAHFQRFEFKYPLSPLQANRILVELMASHMRPDPTVAERHEKRYTVSSLYFDSPGWKCYYENEAGERVRFKLRIRSYETAPEAESLMFLEIKRKDDAIITKDRVAIPHHLYRTVFAEAGDPFQLLDHPAVIGERAVLEEFLSKLSRFAMRPRVLIRYERIPLVGRTNERFRVTLDYGLEASAVPEFSGHDAFRPVFRGRTILEVKYNNTLPHWFHRILQRHELRRTKFSKYFNAVTVLKRSQLLAPSML